MCRNIKTLYNFDPPVTKEEIQASSEQYVRKVSGFTHPSSINEEAFQIAITEVAAATKKLMSSLVTTAEPKNREEEAARAHERALKRFGTA
jgi:hypothetical protein